MQEATEISVFCIVSGNLLYKHIYLKRILNSTWPRVSLLMNNYVQWNITGALLAVCGWGRGGGVAVQKHGDDSVS